MTFFIFSDYYLQAHSTAFKGSMLPSEIIHHLKQTYMQSRSYFMRVLKTVRALFQEKPLIITFIGCLVLSLSSCKKDSDEDPEPQGCVAVAPAAGITYSNASGRYTLVTAGGGKVVVDPKLSVIISYDAYPGFALDLWGGIPGADGVDEITVNHETLNGKHIKDRLGKNRTILFPDGARLTLVTEGVNNKLLSVTLYDGATAHRINVTCNTLVYSAVSLADARSMDEAELDGEAGGFEISATGLKLFNLYTEDTPGNKVNNRYELGELFKAEPTRVNDYYDDPRLNAT